MRIVIRAPHVRGARRIQESLATAGFEAAAYVGEAKAHEAADLLIFDGSDAGAAALAHRVLADEPRPLAVLLASDMQTPPAAGLASHAPFDGALALDAPALLTARRIAAFARAGVSIEERARREATGKSRGVALTELPEPRSLKALYIGAPSPFFLALERAICAYRGFVSGCFSSFAGIDHLHDDVFDAVVLNGACEPQMALSLCAALRRNASLATLPTMMIAAKGDEATAKLAIERGAAAIVSSDADAARAIAWVFDAVRLDRRRKAAEHDLHALRDLMGDPRTGLFLQAPFEAHLERLAEAHHANGRPLALAALNVMPAHGATLPPTELWRKGFTEIASLAGRLVRDSDSAAAYDARTIVVALPSTGLKGGKRAAERISRVGECTAFAVGETGAAPVVFEQSVVELQPGESGLALMARARAALEPASIRA